MTLERTPQWTPVVAIAGWKNAGKTTLVVRLIEEFTRRGLRVASVKHAHHNFQIDTADTDSARHRRAGARQVAIVSDKRWALVTELGSDAEPDLAAVIALLAPCDLIIVEGYKAAPVAKIEVRRGAPGGASTLAPNDPNVIAIATDTPAHHAGALPVFHLDDVPAMADFLAQRFDLRASH